MSYAGALERGRRARAVQPFYEQAWFGPRTSTYTDQLGFSREARLDPPPSTLGGFQFYKPSDAPTPLPGPMPQLPPEVLEQIRREEQARKTRLAYGMPPAGPANLASYGVGQLQNYGVGALSAYQPLESLRRR